MVFSTRPPDPSSPRFLRTTRSTRAALLLGARPMGLAVQLVVAAALVVATGSTRRCLSPVRLLPMAVPWGTPLAQPLLRTPEPRGTSPPFPRALLLRRPLRALGHGRGTVGVRPRPTALLLAAPPARLIVRLTLASRLWRRAWRAMVWTRTTPFGVPLPPTTTTMSRRCGRCCRDMRPRARLCRGPVRRRPRPTLATSSTCFTSGANCAMTASTMGTSTATMRLLRSRERVWLRWRVLLRCRLGVPLACAALAF